MSSNWSDGKKWFMGILSALVIAALIALAKVWLPGPAVEEARIPETNLQTGPEEISPLSGSDVPTEDPPTTIQQAVNSDEGPPQGTPEVVAEIHPQVLRPGEQYIQKLTLINNSDDWINVESVSADTFSDGRHIRSTPRWFNAQRHGDDWQGSSIPPGQRRVIYNRSGTYAAESGCGNLTAKFTFHTNLGDFDAEESYSVLCK